MKWAVTAAVSVSLALGAAHARAATCAINDVQPVVFGAYSPFSGMAGNAQGWVTYQCSLFSALDRVTIDLSTGNSGAYTPWRTLLTGSHPLSYQLYTDAALTKIFGNGTGGTDHYGPVILAILETKVYIYGYIPPSQNAWVGSYSDTIVITMNF